MICHHCFPFSFLSHISAFHSHEKSGSLTRQSVSAYMISLVIISTSPYSYYDRLTIDVFGTCVDWRSCIEKALEEAIDVCPAPDYAALAHKWRQGKIFNLMITLLCTNDLVYRI